MGTFAKFVIEQPEEPLDASVFIKTDKERFKLKLMKKQVKDKLVTQFNTKRPGNKQFSYKLVNS